MLDNATMVLWVDQPEKVLGMLDVCHEVKDLLTGQLKYHWGKVDGLRFTINGKKVKIQNSIHKYFLKDNTGLFTLKQNDLAVEKLSDRIHLDIATAAIPNFEFGVTFKVAESPTSYLDKMDSFKSKAFVPFDSCFNRTNIYYQTEAYRYKLYNKGYEIGDELLNLIRIEIKRNSKSKYLPHIVTVSDFLQKDNFAGLVREHLKMFDKVHFSGSQFQIRNGLKANDISLILALNGVGYPLMRSTFKKHCTPKNYEYHSKRIRKVMRESLLEQNSPRKYLREELKENLLYILNN